MKKILTICTVIVLLFAMVFTFTACGNSNTLYVYTEAGFAPFEFLNHDEVVGLDAIIGFMVAQELGMKLEIKNVDFNAIPEAVKNSPENSLGIAGITICEIDGITFSNPYFTSQQYILAKKGTFTSSSDSLELSVLNNKKVGAQLSTTGHSLLKDSVENNTLTGVEIVTNQKYNFLVESLKNGNLDAIVIDKTPAESYQKANSEDLEIFPIAGADVESYGVEVASSNTKLLATVNKVLASITPEQIAAWVEHYTALANEIAGVNA